VALYALVDNTASVSAAAWADMQDGFGMYVDSSLSAGKQLGLQYFPLQAGGDCNGNGYSTPAITIAALPGNASAVKNWFANRPPNGLQSPMEGVLNGGVAQCKSYLATHPTHQCSFVLLTDWNGSTAQCNNALSNLTPILTTARTTSPSVLTYVIAVDGAANATIDQLASAGGTEFFLSGNTPSQVATGLTKAARACQFDLPKTTGTVSWKLGSMTLNAVSGPSACASSSNSHYVTASSMVLCPATCLAAPSSPNVTYTVSCNG